ncbi:MAG: hypothetical protein WDN27_03600 [Candidatus Saccharibacteria bacterium]
MQALIKRLRTEFPDLQFVAGQQFYWSPATGEIFYKTGADSETARWSLLHETGHALLSHQTYQADFELLQLEIAAWDRARDLATSLDISIDEDHIQGLPRHLPRLAAQAQHLSDLRHQMPAE